MLLVPLFQGTTVSLARAAAGALCWVLPVQPTPFVPVTHRTRMPTGRGSEAPRLTATKHLRPSFPIWPWLIPTASVATPALLTGSSPIVPDGVNCHVTPGRAHPCFAAALCSPCQLWRFGYSQSTLALGVGALARPESYDSFKGQQFHW